MKGRNPWLYVEDMLQFCLKVQAYTEGKDQAGFIRDGLTYDATLRNLELIGEAARHVPPHIQQSAPSIPWRTLIAIRNRIIHGYLGLDNDILWDIITAEIPLLTEQLERLLRDRPAE